MKVIRYYLSVSLGLIVACVTCWATPVDVTQYTGKIKLACVGDSITKGVGSGARNYPAQLSELLGAKWDVKNFGQSSRTMVRGHAAWSSTSQCTNALAFKPDVVTIMLGTNDSKPPEWVPHKASFLADAKALIADFKKINPDVKIYVCLPPPAYPGKWGINDETIRSEICPLVRQVAQESNATLIDTYSAATNRPECFPDTVHPNAAGATLLATAIYQALTGNQATATKVAATAEPTVEKHRKISNPQLAVVPSDSNSKRMAKNYKECEERIAAMSGKQCDVIFIGDSITQAWTMPDRGLTVWDKYYARRHALNFGVGADSTQHVLWRMEHMDIQQFHPKVGVILIGTNNLGYSPEGIAGGVKAVIEKTQQVFSGIQIILVSILPNARATQLMADTDKIICHFADNKSVFYFDLASKMMPEGNSWKGLRSEDRLHLKPEGYELWASNMEPLLKKLLASNP